MQFLCIGVNDCAEDIVEQIANELQVLKNREIDFSINEVNSDGSTSIICSVNEDKVLNKQTAGSYEALRIHVSNALADYIMRQYEQRLLTRIIHSNYCYFNYAERKEILNLALRIISSDEKNFLSSLFRMRRRNLIVRKLMEYFEGSNSLILDGFVNFRLKEYMKDLEDIVDKAVDNFLTDREYKEFIRLLRYFVDIQDPKFNIVHVVVGYDGRYMLLDEARKEITNECIQEFVKDISEGEINFDDLLVSSLITLAPRKIVLHGVGQFKNKELLETIRNVFSGKVLVCSQCEICTVSLVTQESKN